MNLWFPYQGPANGAATRLVCVPYAGGTGSRYLGWQRAFGTEIQILPVQLPGREHRIREPLRDNLIDLAEELAGALAANVAYPYALFGHSMGALLAFEAARSLRRRGKRPPVGLFVSGARPPHLARGESNPVHLMSDRGLRAFLRDAGGTPSEVFRHEALIDVVLPILRADLRACETYQPPGEKPLAIPVTAVGGEADPRVSLVELAGWREHTRAGFRLHSYPGGHFFLHHHVDAIAAVVRADLRRWATDTTMMEVPQ